jgi:hypothetical protein
MNEIEMLFYNAYLKFEEIEDGVPCELLPQQVIGIYKVDFVYADCVIEIDGHGHHKTKEQREYDYKRERYLLRNGYIPIRFTGTEVFLDAYKCVTEMFEIAEGVQNRRIADFEMGEAYGRKRAGEKIGKTKQKRG